MQVAWAVPAGSLKLPSFSPCCDSASSCLANNRLAAAPPSSALASSSASSSSFSSEKPTPRCCFHGRKLLLRAAAASLQESALEEGNAGAMVVKVKFVLQEKCEFGQQFNVVGDDAQLGGWDPAAAIPMQWSEGHVWTTNLDLSAGKRMEFKMILRGKDGEVEWQPGPNRVFETPVTPSCLVVSGSWCGEYIHVGQVTNNSEVLHHTSFDKVDESEDTASETMPVRNGGGFSLHEFKGSNDEELQEDEKSEWFHIPSAINEEEEEIVIEVQAKEDIDNDVDEIKVQEKEVDAEKERDEERKGADVMIQTSHAAAETIESEVVLEEEEVIEEPNLVVLEEEEVVEEPNLVVLEEDEVVEEPNIVVLEEEEVVEKPNLVANSSSSLPSQSSSSSSSSSPSVIEKDLAWGQKALASIWALVQRGKQS